MISVYSFLMYYIFQYNILHKQITIIISLVKISLYKTSQSINKSVQSTMDQSLLEMLYYQSS